MILTEIDLKAAINAISDVIQNRPKPLREFDQIYMKAGDMVMQSELVASWAEGGRLAFVGDGDAISVCVAYLRTRKIIGYGPDSIDVFDFDERVVNAVRRFATREGIDNLSAHLYNCLDPFPCPGRFDHFYTNPPWGASNDGASVNAFVRRGIEAVGYEGDGAIVIGDSDQKEWTKHVLANVQRFVLDRGFYVSRMMPKLHSYHLDDDPSLRSCNLLISSLPDNGRDFTSEPLPERHFVNFYGKDKAPRVRFVREIKPPEYGKANDSEYQLDLLPELDDE